MSAHDSMPDSPPSTLASSSRNEKTTNGSRTPQDAMQSLITSYKHIESMYSGKPRSPPPTDAERAQPPTTSNSGPEPQALGADPPPGRPSEESTDSNCAPTFLVAILWLLIALVMFCVAAIAAISSVSLLLSFVGVTLLGLTRASGGVYANLAVVSLVVATVCGAAIITAAASVLVLAFFPVAMCCGDDALSLTGTITLFGSIFATFFAPAIGIAATNGHIISLNSEFTAAKAMRMNGVGLGGVLACVLAELILVGIVTCLET